MHASVWSLHPPGFSSSCVACAATLSLYALMSYVFSVANCGKELICLSGSMKPLISPTELTLMLNGGPWLLWLPERRHRLWWLVREVAMAGAKWPPLIFGW